MTLKRWQNGTKFRLTRSLPCVKPVQASSVCDYVPVQASCGKVVHPELTVAIAAPD